MNAHLGLWLVCLLAVGACSSHAGFCSADDRQWVNETTPLNGCGVTPPEERPAAGLCAPGFFPDFEISCGPPSRTEDGGFLCGCYEWGTKTSCLPLCTCDAQCAGGQYCDVKQVFWGNDTPQLWRGLCRAR